MTSKTLLTFLIGLAAAGILATTLVSSSSGFLRLRPIPSVPTVQMTAAGSGAVETVVAT